MLDLAPDMREDLIHSLGLIVARIPVRNCDDFFVVFPAADHSQHADRPHLDKTTGKARFFNQCKDIQRVPVTRNRTRNEAVIS
jgi:hypothetical protein